MRWSLWFSSCVSGDVLAGAALKILRYANKLAPYVASPARVVDRMLEMANIRPGETFYDLGCGDGRILIAAVQKYKVKAVGVEISPKLAAKAAASIARPGWRARRA